MVYMSTWLPPLECDDRRGMDPDALGKGARRAQLAHIIVVIYAFISIIGILHLRLKGIGKFAATSALAPQRAISNALPLITITPPLRHQGRDVQRRYHGSAASSASFPWRHSRSASSADDEGRPGTLNITPPSPRLGDNILFGWHSIWTGPYLWCSFGNARDGPDGYGLFGFFVMMLPL